MPPVLDRDAATPLYVQLTDILRDEIERGLWMPDRKIPSENELHRTYGISRMTARQVIAQLVNEGLLYRVQGKGTFVAPNKISTRSPAYAGIREQLEELGYATKTMLLNMEEVAADRAVAKKLALDDGAPVFAIRRLRAADGVPMSLHESYVPVALAPNLDEHDVIDEQLCVVLKEHYGLTMGHVKETLEIVTASAGTAEQLEVRSGAPLLMLKHSIAAPDGRLFEYARITFRGDKVRLHMEYAL